MAENKTFLFRVEDHSAGVRLDLLIPKLLPDLSRSRAQSMISSGCVTVNEKSVSKRYLSRTSDRLSITVPPREESLFQPEDIPLDIIHEDSDMLVVDKPAGMVIHPAPGHREGTLVNALLFRTAHLSAAGGEERPGIVHRLDRGTSGIVLVARNDVAHRNLAAQFARRQVKKTYLALAAGRLKESVGTWESPIGRDRKDRKKMSSRTSAPRSAVTHYKTIASPEGASLLVLHPETGRTHQLRVHLVEAGHPILGDNLYGPKPRRGSRYHELCRIYGCTERLALHAWKISCRHPVTGEELSFEAPAPAPFEGLLPS